MSFVAYFCAFILLLNVLGAAAQRTEEQKFPTFRQFILKFNKTYQSQEEYQNRETIYLKNIQYIKDSNCSSCGANFYADWTLEEISQLRLVKESEKKEKVGAIPKQMHSRGRLLASSIPAHFDWRDTMNITDVKNQGYCGASWAFSAAAFFEQESIQAGLADTSLNVSESYLIGCNPEVQGCYMGYIESSLDLVMDKGGIPLETQYKFDPSASFPAAMCFQNNLFAVPNKTRISYYRVQNSETIKKILLKKPVVAAVCGMDFAFYYPSSSNDSSRTLSCKPEHRLIDHSVLLVGYTETEWIVKNHWGKGWGVDGYAYISKNPAYDCCIGMEIHSSGEITPNCSVEHCQICVQSDTCYRCEPGRWVQHNTTTGVQTCEPCLEENCAQCYNYLGTCKWCAYGFALNITTGKCVNSTIANCNLLDSNLCSQCKTGYRLSNSHATCVLNCATKNCGNCTTGSCIACKTGFNLTNTTVGTLNIHYCNLYPCSVGNCTYCNQTGQCIQCNTYYVLQASGSCTNSNCTSIPSCLSCASGSTTCTECVEGKSWNSTKKACETFSGTTNCKVHKTSCTSCKSGFTLTSGKCVQNCDTASCTSCKKNDVTWCLVCADGYTLSTTTYQSYCVKNVCNITNCSFCATNGSCLACATTYLVYNATANQCESQCQIANCRDCLPNATTCARCNNGFAIDNSNKSSCVATNITNCPIVYYYMGDLECYQCDKNYYLNYDTYKECLIWCTDYYCEFCQIETLHICQKCFDGYYMYLSEGALTCLRIPSLMTGCYRVSYNQSYCFECEDYYVRNENTGKCELNTKNCPDPLCEYCTGPEATYSLCVCQKGYAFQFYSQKCIPHPFNNSCVVVQLYAGSYYCDFCPAGQQVNMDYTGCELQCLIPNCTECISYDNTQCVTCDFGFYVDINSSCTKCAVENCYICDPSKCLQCNPGFDLSPNGQNCTKVICSHSFIFNGYECICPISTYRTESGCIPCRQKNCYECTENQCFICSPGYFVNDTKCAKCMPNCETCLSAANCSKCKDDFVWDPVSVQCLKTSDLGGSVAIQGDQVIKCPFECLACTAAGVCTKCLSGFALSVGTCVACGSNCKTCASSNISSCTSCSSGYFLNKTECVPCNRTNCQDCSLSSSVCVKCADGFFMNETECQPCKGQKCTKCDLYGNCTQCETGYALMEDLTCRLCIGNCKSCNSSAIYQCLETCKANEYQVGDGCATCPSNCLACSSATACSSCASGYVLRTGQCKKVCEQGCYECDSQNSSFCTKCYQGYSLSQAGTCAMEIACNDNASCVVCPISWTLVNHTCEICNTEGDCLQCANEDVNLCIQCKLGFYLFNNTCLACKENCLQCSNEVRCQTCKDGFYLPKGVTSGECATCDASCRTCEDVYNKCTSCKDGYELSVINKCTRVQKVETEVQLDTTYEGYLNISDQISSEFLKMLGSQYENSTELFTVMNLRFGSVILTINMAIPDNQDPDAVYASVKDKIASLTSVGSTPVISVLKINLINPNYKPPNNDTTNNSNNTNNNQNQNTNTGNETENSQASLQDSKANSNVLAIVLGVVIPCVVILLVIITFILKCKIFKRNEVLNLSETGIVEKNDFIPHTKIVLPPLVQVTYNFTPLKENQIDRFNSTGQPTSFAITTAFVPEMSYQRLDPNENSKAELVNEFDNTLQNIVAEINDNNQSVSPVKNQEDGKIIEFDDEISEIKGDLSEFKGEKPLLKPIEPLIHHEPINENPDEIMFDDNTGREFKNERKEASQQGIRQKLGPENGKHLQVIDFTEDDPNLDL